MYSFDALISSPELFENALDVIVAMLRLCHSGDGSSELIGVSFISYVLIDLKNDYCRLMELSVVFHFFFFTKFFIINNKRL